MHLTSGNSPDEFAILPTKALEAPPDYRALPSPTPGGTNRTDPTPQADAIAALGGRAAAAGTSGEAALMAYAGRLGTDPGIRADLAAKDLEWRRQNDGRLLERLFSVNVYYKAYKAMSLDQHGELRRLRAAGVKTPAAPPDPAIKRD